MPVKDIPEVAYGDPEVAKAAISQEGENARAGWLGKFLGTGTNASINIVSIVLFVVVIFLLIHSVLAESPTKEHIDVWMPLIMSIIGYLFGTKTNK